MLIKSFFLFFSFLTINGKVYNICKQASGIIFLLPCINGVELGQISMLTSLPLRFFRINKAGDVFFLKFANKFSIFSNMFFKTIPKYCTSRGTYCQVLDKLQDYNLLWITLPSRKTILVSGWHYVLSGRNSLTDYNTITFASAGSLKFRGLKPSVRGVARNPVDHPHGGRTKTNKPEKSIWGWIAKKNK